MKIQLCIIKFPENKRPSLCLKQGGRIIALGVLNHDYSEHFIKRFLNGCNAIEKECDFDFDDLWREVEE